jgi:hypothetical protein
LKLLLVFHGLVAGKKYLKSITLDQRKQPAVLEAPVAR